MSTREDLSHIFETVSKGLAHPEAYEIARQNIQFELFGTLTFHEGSRRSKRMIRFISFLRELARRKRIHYKSLSWVLRHEIGASQIPHLHFLLNGFPETVTAVSSLMKLWERMGNGNARISTYDPTRSGFIYVFKKLPNRRQEPFVAGERWEESREIEISHSILNQTYRK